MFRIWYTDGFSDGNDISDWINLPESGVVAIYQTHGFKGNIRLGSICSGSDWYWMNESGIIEQNGFSVDTPGEWSKVNIPDNAITKKGIWVSDERMNQVNLELIEMAEN